MKNNKILWLIKNLLIFLIAFYNFNAKALEKHDSCYSLFEHNETNWDFNVISTHLAAVELMGIISTPYELIQSQSYVFNLKYLISRALKLRSMLIDSPLYIDINLVNESYDWIKKMDAFLNKFENNPDSIKPYAQTPQTLQDFNQRIIKSIFSEQRHCAVKRFLEEKQQTDPL